MAGRLAGRGIAAPQLRLTQLSYGAVIIADYLP